MITDTSAPLAPSAMIVPEPTLVMADDLDREGCDFHDDFAWMEHFYSLREMTGELGSGCRDHGPRRPFLGFCTTDTCTASPEHTGAA